MMHGSIRSVWAFARQSRIHPRSRRLQSTETYYDSQSGLHLPKHNEKFISMFLDISRESPHQDGLISPQLYKEDSSDVPDKLQALQDLGVRGVRLPPATFSRDFRNLRTLHHVAPSGLKFFVAIASSPPLDLSSLSIMHEFPSFDENASELQQSLDGHARVGTHTTVRLGESVCSEYDPVLTGSRLATLIDRSHGVDSIWISPSLGADVDDVSQLCEELMYHDVAGPTIKSRIIIDSFKEELIVETMLMGINKFVVTDNSQMDLVAEIARAQGKEILFA